MSRPARIAVALAAAALAAAPAAHAAPLALGPDGIVARGAVAPRAALFAEPLTARVDAVFDPKRVEPSSVHLVASFRPYERTSDIAIRSVRVGAYEHVRYVATLRCLGGGCAPNAARTRFHFVAARIVYRPRGAARRRSVRVEWPPVLVASRLDLKVIAKDIPAGRLPWRADLATLPTVSYRVPPGLALWLLVALASALALAGVALAWRGLRPAPAPPPLPIGHGLPPLERAVVLLEHAQARGDARERRKALELLSSVLTVGGADELAADARELAWSEDDPPVEGASTVALRARELLVRRSHRNGGDPRTNGA